MSQDPIFNRSSVLDAPEAPNLQPDLAERAVLFEVVRVTPRGRPLPAAAPAPLPPAAAPVVGSPMVLAVVGLVSGSTGAVAAAAGIALGLVLGATLPQLAVSPAADVHTVVAAAPNAMAFTAAPQGSTVDSHVEVEHTELPVAAVRTSPRPEISVAAVLPHLQQAEPLSVEVEDSNDALAEAEPEDSFEAHPVWGAPPPHFESHPPAPPPPLRLAAAAPTTRPSAPPAAPEARVKLVDRLGLRKRD